MSIDVPPTVASESESLTQAAGAAASQPPGAPPATGEHGSPGGWFGWWQATPLYLRILAACVLGVAVGVLLGKNAEPLAIPSQLVLRLLGALAAPLILLAVIQALMQAHFPRGSGLRLVSLLALNTLVAIFIGLAVANIVRPGKWTNAGRLAAEGKREHAANLFEQFLDNVPRSLLGPLGDGGKVISVILLAIAFGIALRRLKDVKVVFGG